MILIKLRAYINSVIDHYQYERSKKAPLVEYKKQVRQTKNYLEYTELYYNNCLSMGMDKYKLLDAEICYLEAKLQYKNALQSYDKIILKSKEEYNNSIDSKIYYRDRAKSNLS